jgi:hypothetical protein
MAFGNGNFATPVSFTGILAGTTVVAGFAATLPLAFVLAFAGMLGRRCATAMTFAGVFAGAAIVAGFTVAVTLALVHALAGVLIACCGRLVSGKHTLDLRTCHNPGYRTEQHFVKASPFYTHSETLAQAVEECFNCEFRWEMAILPGIC